MKTRFNTYDIICNVTDLQRLVGMRVNQVYDIDNKAYLIRLQRSEEKVVLLLESANRFHTTQFEWPKNVAPSGFTMKLRKHLKNKRLEKLTQLGIDRIVDFQFGTGEAAYHVILELYDRGNIILTDYNWTILNVLRPHVEGDKIRFAVREQYPLDRAKLRPPPPSADQLKEILENSKPGDTLKKILNPNLEYGPGIIDHILAENSLSGNMRITKEPDGKGFHIEQDLSKLLKAITLAEEMLDKASTTAAKGYITQKKEERPKTGDTEGPTFLMTNVEFHPFLYSQHKAQPYKEFETFDSAIDEFYSTLEGQKIDLKAVVMEREAYKKLQNVKKDHDKRLTELERLQADDRSKADLISHNQALVDNAILAIQSALANQVPWEDIKELVKAAKENGDPTASSIKHLKLESNHISLLLSDPYSTVDDVDDDEANEESSTRLKPMIVDIDLALTAYANARRYYDQKRTAAKKQQKTLESKGKALKSAEKKTKLALKEVQTISSINKARKVYWFEKFYWFISSENYLIIGGRDQQQNELLVKRYMKPADVYVHADVSGASSIIIKNPGAGAVPPKTLNEAGLAAVSYSVAWEAKVLTSAWWVHAAQVSKSAPTGEFLTTGSFMIRGKKNYLLPSQLTMGFSFMFRLEESCIERHLNERRVINLNDELLSEVSEKAGTEQEQEDQEIVISDDEDDDSGTESKPIASNLDVITEETTNITIGKDSEVISSIKIENDTNEVNDDDRNSSEEDGPRFPDTHIKVDHDKGKVFTENMQRVSESNTDNDILSFPSLPNRKGKKGNMGSKLDNKVKAKEPEEQQKTGLKRGQRSKLKKIKEKYRHQDEEDLANFMDYIKPDGTSKEKKPLKKNLTVGGKNKARAKIPQPAPQILHLDESDGDGEPELEQEAEPVAATSVDTELLSQLTGCPLTEDELLFAVPVVAPYSALQHYKYKIKLTPGTAKRGKAAKLSLQIFARDKMATQREKDLLKAVKDEDTARNFPGKVKVSTPHLKNIRK